MKRICTHCHWGSPHQQQVTWARLVGTHLILVPSMGAWVCDVCGSVEYDSMTLDRIESLLRSGSQLNAALSTSSSRGTTPEPWQSGRPIQGV